ncbi:MAG: hypothetical protein ABJB12_01745 [Pseudomonadota bacterium]
MRPRARTALCALLLSALLPRPAAALVHRRHFEPDDLELDPVGVLDLDFQVGPLHGDSAGKNRLILPDFEIGLGLAPEFELNVSGAFSVNESRAEPRHLSSDPLWVASKLGLLDAKDDAGNAWAGGIELGPRLPVLDAGGIGFGVLALFGVTHRAVTLVLNAGCLIDPGANRGAEHPTALVTGLDLNAALDTERRWSLQAELSTAYYVTADPEELSATLGATYAVTPHLDVSITALGGVLPNTDHAGLLVGVSPELGLW